MIEHRAFFGDGEKVFAFPTLEIIRELEAATGHGIGALHRRFRFEDFSLSDIEHVIRLGLIGGGTTPADAARLVTVYLVGRPLRETLDLASDVISVLFYGNDADDTTDQTTDSVKDAAKTGDLAAALNDALKQVAE
ncbi:tail tube GTA-gp10-like protein [Ciceribacter lividus]|uniref:Tail tube GTA-gp10-like protein n=1 Tax=Ciceribacter lividus TaxID=1197950 RepID=A0A6I7HRS7_9HYPH|nr:gene transfer agent family protein [Ciceribacter lividus]RCW27810.1 tail tube GTA-gp10-like protein [Ciceribacter lividus]